MHAFGKLREMVHLRVVIEFEAQRMIGVLKFLDFCKERFQFYV